MYFAARFLIECLQIVEVFCFKIHTQSNGKKKKKKRKVSSVVIIVKSIWSFCSLDLGSREGLIEVVVVIVWYHLLEILIFPSYRFFSLFWIMQTFFYFLTLVLNYLMVVYYFVLSLPPEKMTFIIRWQLVNARFLKVIIFCVECLLIYFHLMNYHLLSNSWGLHGECDVIVTISLVLDILWWTDSVCSLL